MDSTGSKKRVLAVNLPNSPSSVTWAQDSSGLYYLMREKGESNLYFISLNRKFQKITNGVHYLSGLSMAGDGQVASTLSTFHKPGYLVTFNLQNPLNIAFFITNKKLYRNQAVRKVKSFKTEYRSYSDRF